jgi:hypothetical protein
MPPSPSGILRRIITSDGQAHFLVPELGRVGRTIEAMPIHWIHEAPVLAAVIVCEMARRQPIGAQRNSL